MGECEICGGYFPSSMMVEYGTRLLCKTCRDEFRDVEAFAETACRGD